VILTTVPFQKCKDLDKIGTFIKSHGKTTDQREGEGEGERERERERGSANHKQT